VAENNFIHEVPPNIEDLKKKQIFAGRCNEEAGSVGDFPFAD